MKVWFFVLWVVFDLAVGCGVGFECFEEGVPVCFSWCFGVEYFGVWEYGFEAIVECVCEGGEDLEQLVSESSHDVYGDVI